MQSVLRRRLLKRDSKSHNFFVTATLVVVTEPDWSHKLQILFSAHTAPVSEIWKVLVCQGGRFIHHTAACRLRIYLFVLLKALEEPPGAQVDCNKVENTCDFSESVRFAPLWSSLIFYKLLSPRQATRQRRRDRPPLFSLSLTLKVASSPLAGKTGALFREGQMQKNKTQNNFFISPAAETHLGGGVSAEAASSAHQPEASPQAVASVSPPTYLYVIFFVGWIPVLFSFFLSTGRISSQKKLKCSSCNLEPSLCRYVPRV